jgi:hypothetical protein
MIRINKTFFFLLKIKIDGKGQTVGMDQNGVMQSNSRNALSAQSGQQQIGYGGSSALQKANGNGYGGSSANRFDPQQVPHDNRHDGQDRHEDGTPDDYFISELYGQLSSVINAKPIEIEPLRIDDAEDPACVPMLWVSKWVDYSDKYGLGYQLCDESVGVLFNDSTRLILCSSGE